MTKLLAQSLCGNNKIVYVICGLKTNSQNLIRSDTFSFIS